jgi:tRNA pseudouridine13 synthase
MFEAWIERALAPPRAFGAALGRGRLRVEPEDFVVEEDLGFAPSGAGSHVLLKVRKRNANTEWVARELARAAGCRQGDVGFAGLKDRRAVAVQWFTVPLPRAKSQKHTVAAAASVSAGMHCAVGNTNHASGNSVWSDKESAGVHSSEVGPKTVGVSLALADLAAIRGQDFEVLEAHAHAKKLPRGALAGNRFTIRVRELQADDAQLGARFAAIARTGLPNFFGPQRFGRDGANLRKIGRDPNTVHPRERGYVLSAARSLVFNAVLGERVADGTWSQLEVGDVANLDARGSVFPVDTLDESLQERAARLDVHPTGPMWGRGELLSRARVQALEERVGAELEDPCALVLAAGMRQERRSLRLAVRELEWSWEGDDVVIRFWLTRGSFATTVLREILDTESASPDGDPAAADEG